MPYVKVWVDDPEVTLSEHDSESLIEELEKRGFAVVAALEPEGLERITHLLDCGLAQYAAEEALSMVEQQIGRPHALHAH